MLRSRSIRLIAGAVVSVAILGGVCTGAEGDVLPPEHTPWVDALEVLLYADVPVTLLNGMMLLGHKESGLSWGFGVFLGATTIGVSVGALFLEEYREDQNRGLPGLLVGGVTLGFGILNVISSEARTPEPDDAAMKLSPGVFRGVDGRLSKGVVFRRRF